MEIERRQHGGLETRVAVLEVKMESIEKITTSIDSKLDTLIEGRNKLLGVWIAVTMFFAIAEAVIHFLKG